MRYVLTSDAQHRAQVEFRLALDASMLPYRMGQLELFSDEEEQFIQHEVERKLHKPKLPNAGPRERLWLEKLKAFARDESLVVNVKAAAGRYAVALESLLPRQEFIRKKMRVKKSKEEEEETEPGGKQESNWLTLPGCYYTRRPITSKTNKSLFAAAVDLKTGAGKDMEKKWLAQFLLDGEPEAVSNFKMECLYLLRGADGNVTRLVRLVNTLGEISEGREIGGADVLPSEEFGSAEKFRTWCLGKGNFNWGVGGGAGNLELQMLHSDVSAGAAYRVIRLIEYCGWHEIVDPLKETLTTPGQVKIRGLWFMDECAYADGVCILPDDEGIFWHDGVGYAFARKGRETEFTHGRPQMKPGLKIESIKFDIRDWETGIVPEKNMVGQFFREMCRRFFDTAGGYEGWMAVGAMLGFAAAPEIYHQRRLFPSLWVSGQMGSGKTVFCSWLMGLHGFHVASGLGLISKNVTPVGIMCQLENYSNMGVWADEFRQVEVGADKLAILRDAYNRQLAAKWSPDGFQRQIRTAFLVSGESTTSDAATRSRYPHILLSEQKRKVNHYDWFQSHHEYFFFFWRTIMERREEFITIVLKQIEFWMQHEDLKSVPSRDRITHSVCYAALSAATVIFESHTAEEVVAYRKFVASHAAASAVDVQADVNVNIFIQDVITAFKDGEIPPEFFRVEKKGLPNPPGAPNQGRWDSYTLFMDPNSVISSVQAYLRQRGLSVSLRYKDLRDQLSKNEFWVEPVGTAGDKKPKLNKRFGKRGQLTTVTAWGFKVDVHPLGLQHIDDETYHEALSKKTPNLGDIGPMFEDGDPRKGELFAIIEGVEKYEARERQEERES